MPRIISYTPSWLSRPSPGFHLFEGSAHTRSSGQRQDGESLINGSRAGSDFLGPNRTIARRGSEIFVGVGKQIRWSDLPMLKDQWDLEQETPSKKPSSLANGKSERDKDDGPVDGSYRVWNMFDYSPSLLIHYTDSESESIGTNTAALNLAQRSLACDSHIPHSPNRRPTGFKPPQCGFQ